MKTASLIFGTSLLFAVPAVTQAGAISSSTITDDATSGINSAKTYTHKLDFGQAAAATVNGVAFDSVLAPGNATNFTYAVSSGTANDNPGNANTGVTAGSGIDTLLGDMVYNGNNAAAGTATFTVSGLTPGTQYSARLYSRKWTATDLARSATIAFDEDGAGALGSSQTFDQSATNTAQYIEYTYTATASPLTITFTQTTFNQSWHQYGFTNEVVAVPEPGTAAIATVVAGATLARRRRRGQPTP